MKGPSQRIVKSISWSQSLSPLWGGWGWSVSKFSLANLSYLWCAVIAEQTQARTSLGLARNLERRAEKQNLSANLFLYTPTRHMYTGKGPLDPASIGRNKRCSEDAAAHVHPGTADPAHSHTASLCPVFSLGFYQFWKTDSTLIECLDSSSLFDSHGRPDVQQPSLRNTVIFT